MKKSAAYMDTLQLMGLTSAVAELRPDINHTNKEDRSQRMLVEMRAISLKRSSRAKHPAGRKIAVSVTQKVHKDEDGESDMA
ncbi:MAG: hypothetical protein ACP5E2_16685 [Terracidiphilus sp.]